MAKRASEIDRIAAQQLALEYVVANMAAMQRIAGGCHVDVCEVTGPAVDAVASLLLRNSDPSENIALLRDYVKRELRPCGTTFDPHELEAHGGRLPALDLSDAWLFHTEADGRVRHVQRRWHVDTGRDHRHAGWRARARRGRTIQDPPKPKPKPKPTARLTPVPPAPTPEGVRHGR